MQFGTIASGSSGNCLYAGDGENHILIDAGISGKRIQAGLESFGVNPGAIDAVLVTHEHIDHIAGLGVIARKYKIPIYATQKTLEEIEHTKSVGKIPTELFRTVRPENTYCIGDIHIRPFSISHDAADPVSYVLENHCVKIGMVTDLGVYDEDTVEHLKDSDLLYVEANHDIRMLQAGPYPYYLKQRILGSRGHLCNEKAGSLIRELCSDRLKNVILGHLSKENNYPQLALETVKLEFRDFWESGKKTGLSVAPRSEASELVVF